MPSCFTSVWALQVASCTNASKPFECAKGNSCFLWKIWTAHTKRERNPITPQPPLTCHLQVAACVCVFAFEILKMLIISFCISCFVFFGYCPHLLKVSLVCIQRGRAEGLRGYEIQTKYFPWSIRHLCTLVQCDLKVCIHYAFRMQ